MSTFELNKFTRRCIDILEENFPKNKIEFFNLKIAMKNNIEVSFLGKVKGDYLDVNSSHKLVFKKKEKNFKVIKRE